MREKLTQELEKSLDILYNLPLRHLSWNRLVCTHKEWIEEILLKEKTAILNEDYVYKNYTKTLIEIYQNLNREGEWLESILIEDLSKILENYSYHLNVSLDNLYPMEEHSRKVLWSIDLKFDKPIEFRSIKDNHIYQQALVDFCIDGEDAKQLDKCYGRTMLRKEREYNV